MRQGQELEIQECAYFFVSLLQPCQITWKNCNLYNMFSALSALGYECEHYSALKKKKVEVIKLLCFLR